MKCQSRITEQATRIAAAWKKNHFGEYRKSIATGNLDANPHPAPGEKPFYKPGDTKPNNDKSNYQQDNDSV